MGRWLQDLVRYAHQKLLPPAAWRHARDGRKRPEILPGTLWLTAWMGFLLQVPSVEQLERLARRHFRRWLPRGQRPPSGDALRDGMDRADLGALQRLFIAVMKAVKAMKAVPFVDGWRVAAIDATHFFSSPLCKCEDCRAQHHRDGSVTYNHAAVFCHGVGPAPRLFWGYEPMHPGEGETTAALRLLAWLYTHFKHFVDVLLFDAGFAKAPFLRAVLGYGYHFVVRLKDERMQIVQDALGLFARRRPDRQWVEAGQRGKPTVEVKVWEDEGFTSWEGMPPLRVVYVEETELSGRRAGTVHRILAATDLSAKQAPLETIRRLVHARWVIENTGFHEAKTRWHLDHGYVHTATAIQAVHWLQMLAINVMRMFFQRHLRAFGRDGETLAEAARALVGELCWGPTLSPAVKQLIWDTS